MPISREVLGELLKEYKIPEDLLGDQGILQELTKALVERALEGELTHHLGYDTLTEGHNSGNSRNGTSTKTVRGKRGDAVLEEVKAWQTRALDEVYLARL